MNLSIGRKISAGFALLVFLISLLGITCFVSLQEAKTSITEVRAANERSQLAAAAALANRSAVAYTSAFLDNGEEKYFQQVRDEVDKMLAALSRLAALAPPDEKAEARRMLDAAMLWRDVLYNEIFTGAKAIAAETDAGNMDAIRQWRREVERSVASQKAFADELAAALRNVKRHNDELMETGAEEAAATISRVIETVTGTSLAAAILGILTGTLISRTIHNQLSILLAGTQKFAGGDWQKSIVMNTKDEFGELAASLNAMRHNTQNLIAGLQSSESQLLKAKDELEAAVDQRTSEIMAMNEELTAANQQLTAMYEDQAAASEEIIAMNETLVELNKDLTAMNEERFRRAIDFAPFPLMIHAEDGEVMRLSHAWTQITGYTRQDIPTIGVWTAKAYGQDAEKIQREIRPLYGIDSPVHHGEFTIRTKSGEERIWRFSSAPLGIFSDGGRTVISMAADITEHKQAEIKLRESEERYRAVIQQSSDAIVIINPETKQLLEANQRWLDIFGYSQEEVSALTVYDLRVDTPERIDDDYSAVLSQDGPGQIRIGGWRRKDGRIFEGERAGALIHYGGQEVYVVSIRDLSRERMLQQEISKDVALAAIAQKNLLPGGFRDTLLTLEAIYEPYLLVSGDFYGYTWSNDNKRFIGFILDIAGHGVSSAIRGFMASTLFREILDSPMSLTKRLHWVNHQILHYYNDETFVAALCFEFNFAEKTVQLVTAGIYECLISSPDLPSARFRKAGSFIGLTETPEYTVHTLALHPGDAFYFMTDGIFERLPPTGEMDAADFDNTVALLNEIAANPDKKDDCSALCVRIAGPPQLPVTFGFSRPRERERVRTRIAEILSALLPQQARKVDVALGEALNNAVRSGVEIRVRVKTIGRWLIIRVKDSGAGFPGNDYLAALQEQSDSLVFEERLLAEGGRGIPIILAWMDRVLYNRQGNEIMLIKEIAPQSAFLS